MTSTTATDIAMLCRALELAERGIGSVEPNPAVGAVIADDLGQVIGEGWHERFGGAHAEVNALNAAGNAARGATLYVTLEPCCHFGKTPPCSRAVIAAGIRRVVVGTIDPAHHVAGGGIQELKNAGIVVDVGLLDDNARQLIAPFTKLMTRGLPWFHAKWAMTLDGKIATRTGSSKWISNEASREVVHQLRGRMDGILTGIGTVLADDPLMTARPGGPRTPTRIVLDSTCRTPVDSHLIRTIGEAPVMIVATQSATSERCDLLRAAGAEVLLLDGGFDEKPDLSEMALELGRRQMTNILIEGGRPASSHCFDQKIVDEVHVFVAPKLVGGLEAYTPVGGRGFETMAKAMRLDQVQQQNLGGDVYIHGRLGTPKAESEAVIN